MLGRFFGDLFSIVILPLAVLVLTVIITLLVVGIPRL